MSLIVLQEAPCPDTMRSSPRRAGATAVGDDIIIIEPTSPLPHDFASLSATLPTDLGLRDSNSSTFPILVPSHFQAPIRKFHLLCCRQRKPGPMHIHLAQPRACWECLLFHHHGLPEVTKQLSSKSLALSLLNFQRNQKSHTPWDFHYI